MDEITKIWFGGRDIQLNAEASISSVFERDELVALSGAVNGSQVAASLTDIGVKLECRSPVVNRDTHLVEGENGWEVLVAHMRVHHDYSGRHLAARSLAIQARTAQALEFKSIELYAAGNLEMAKINFKEDRWVGYWVWPRLGFDAELPEHVARRIRPHFRNVKFVSELMNSDAGRNTWQVYGDSLDLSFDLTAGSLSWQLLECYTKDRNIVI